MKKTLIILFCSLILFSCERAPYIKDYKIEGIGLGDSLLDYFSEEEITTQIKVNRYKYKYDHLSEDFGNVNLFNENFEVYDHISFFVKPDDKKYIIYLIRGVIVYIEDSKRCHKKQNEIVEDFSKMFKDAKKVEQSFKSSYDPSGKSTIDKVKFIFNSGDEVQVNCSNYEEKLRMKNNWSEGLDVEISTKEVVDWLKNY